VVEARRDGYRLRSLSPRDSSRSDLGKFSYGRQIRGIHEARQPVGALCSVQPGAREGTCDGGGFGGRDAIMMWSNEI
jgi:hypothetical protein